MWVSLDLQEWQRMAVPVATVAVVLDTTRGWLLLGQSDVDGPCQAYLSHDGASWVPIDGGCPGAVAEGRAGLLGLYDGRDVYRLEPSGSGALRLKTSAVIETDCPANAR